MTTPGRSIGVIVVHGIGEETRFEHLEDRARRLTAAIDVICKNQGRAWGLEVLEAQGSTLFAPAQTWQAGPRPPVKIHIAQNPNGVKGPEDEALELCFYEVWWADINDPPGLRKDLMFWLWALSIWLIPDKEGSKKKLYLDTMLTPAFPPGENRRFRQFLVHLRLYAVSCVSVLATTSLAVIINVGQRVFDLDVSSIKAITTFISYVSCIKVYSQPSLEVDPLDGFDEPPRYAIRRRMVRTMIDVASANHAKWFMLAHSMGSVIAFNGLMEPEETLPNYLDETRWKIASARFAQTPGAPVQGPLPHLPSWIPPGSRLSRLALFENFGGLLTYGSPLDKFAAVWPARVPINQDLAPLAGKRWLNVFDPTDPVGDALSAFGALGAVPFAPENYAYRASRVFLQSHLCYFNDASPAGLAGTVVRWMMGANPPRDEFLPSSDPKRVVLGSASEVALYVMGWSEAVLFLIVLWIVSVASTTFILEHSFPSLMRWMASLMGWADVIVPGRGHRSWLQFWDEARVVAAFSIPSIPLVVAVGGLLARLTWHRADQDAVDVNDHTYQATAHLLHRGADSAKTPAS